VFELSVTLLGLRRWINNSCISFFFFSGVSVNDLSAKVTSPGGKTESAKIVEVEEGFYAVNFVPKELGKFLVDADVLSSLARRL
jgi:hypothetical protein